MKMCFKIASEIRIETYIASCSYFCSKNVDFWSLWGPFLALFWHLVGIIFAICFQYRSEIDFFSILSALGALVAPGGRVKPGLAWERKERE